MLTIALGSRRDALFPAIPVSNVAIGSLQEIGSKQTLDRLAALAAPEAVVMRDAVGRRVPVDQGAGGGPRARGDGDQVVADGMVVSPDGLALNKAYLTSESKSAVRGPGEPVWSGSFVVEAAAPLTRPADPTLGTEVLRLLEARDELPE